MARSLAEELEGFEKAIDKAYRLRSEHWWKLESRQAFSSEISDWEDIYFCLSGKYYYPEFMADKRKFYAA